MEGERELASLHFAKYMYLKLLIFAGTLCDFGIIMILWLLYFAIFAFE